MVPSPQAADSFLASNPKPHRRPSAVSTALRSMKADPASIHRNPPLLHLKGYRFRVANDLRSREKAYALAYQSYVTKGYVRRNPTGHAVSRYDRHPETFTLLAEDPEGNVAGTVTVVCDSQDQLPCDEVFSEDLKELRGQGKRLVEVTRLALSPELAHPQTVLSMLFNLIYIGARHIRGADTFVVEVNPRHVAYYRRLFGFGVLSAPRPCPRVQGEAAVLLSLNLVFSELERDQVQRTCPSRRPPGQRWLYQKFLSQHQDRKMAVTIQKQLRPMTAAEAAYFQIR